jgi:hypothetical protein
MDLQATEESKGKGKGKGRAVEPSGSSRRVELT